MAAGGIRAYLTPAARKGLWTVRAFGANGVTMRADDVKRIAVIGAGTMGAGIAQACAAAGFQVTMRDIEQRFVDGGFRRIKEPLQKRVEKGKMTQAEVDGILSKIRGDVRRHHAAGQGPLYQARQGGRRGEGVARVRREPSPRADDERGVQPPPRRRREPGGHRQGDEARDEHADGALRTRGLHGARHRPRRDGGPPPRDGRSEVPALAVAAEVRPRRSARAEDGPRRVRIPSGMIRTYGPIGGSCGGIAGGIITGGFRRRTAKNPMMATTMTTSRISQIQTGRPRIMDPKNPGLL